MSDGGQGGRRGALATSIRDSDWMSLRRRPPERTQPIASASQRRHIDRKAILDVRLDHALVRFINLLNTHHLDVRDDAVCAAEIEHLLGLGDAADGGA